CTDAEVRHAGGGTVLCLGGGALRENPVDDAVLNLIGVAQNVARVEAKDFREIVNPGYEPIGRVRLDHVLYLAAENGMLEHAGERWRAEVHGRFQGFPVNRI